MNEVNISSLGVDGVDPKDYPDFCDAYFTEGYKHNGEELLPNELEYLELNYPDVLQHIAYMSLQ
jgi:hypothetical protein